MLELEQIRGDFPILNTQVHGQPLVYLDNGATMQVPVQVLRAVEEQYAHWQANIHRGIHYLSEQSTVRVEEARKHLARFLNAAAPEEILFTSGTTEGINLVARSFGEAFLHPGDTVVTTEMEHHSNLIPWQEACRRTGAALEIVHLTDRGELDTEEFRRLMALRPKLMAVTCVSNVLGTVNPVEELIAQAHQAGAAVLLDAAQAMRHRVMDVQTLDCDFLCFSGHKIMGPTGTGVLYGKREWLERLPPVRFGGGMVDEVTARSATWGELPFKFEAGTQNIAGIIGLAAAVSYLEKLGIPEISAREDALLRRGEEGLRAIPGVEVLGSPARRAGAVSFNLKGFHYYDTARLLDQLGIAVRSGHHCAQPLLARFGLTGAVRVTPAFYNTEEEMDALLRGVERVASLAGGLRT